jgi:Cellulase (glycosyl hydrolase family 5)/Secretion system C-terminal sorting domain
MINYKHLFSLFLVLIFCTEVVKAQAVRPEYNTGSGFFVLDGKLYDSSGNEFIPIGANTAVFWQPEANAMKSFPDMKKAGANCARIVSVTNNADNSWSWQSNFTKQKACVKACIDNKLIPILEFHDVTCGNGYESDADGKFLKKVVDYWCTPNLVTLCKDYEKYLIVNVANEWGPTNSGFRDGYKKAITALLAAGIKNTILIDAGGCGQNPTTLINYAQELLDFDPQKNILFSIHFYGNWMTKEKSKQSWQFYVEDYLQLFKDKKIPVIVGEFGWTGAPDNFTLYDPKKIITESNRHGIGWLFWAWNSNPNETYYDIVANYTKGFSTDADLTEHGKFIVQQYKDNAKEARSFLATSSSQIQPGTKPALLIYPNPLINNILNIDYTGVQGDNLKQIELKNISGCTIKNIPVTDDIPRQLVLEKMTPGTYFLFFKGATQNFTTKLIITN